MPGYADEAVEGFERSRACFEQIVVGLAAGEADGQTHTELEERLAGEALKPLSRIEFTNAATATWSSGAGSPLAAMYCRSPSA